MMDGGLRPFASAVMLLLYISMLAVGSVISLTCECEHHHHADIHTSFAHVHQCTHSCHEECAGVQITDHHCCNHDHSNQVELYTQPRITDDETIMRHSMVLAFVAQELLYGVVDEVILNNEYRQLILPLLADGYVRCSSLRAPPALV